jgi:NADH dehydrogenase/NADH:ubiquinone oxidoreductase subunit G
MSELEKSDLCLLIGTNPRYEGSLYNVHLRKRFLQGGFKIASIGSPVELTYPVSHLGLGTQTLQDLALGKNSFFDEMLKAKSPMILLGSALVTKKDYSLIEGLCLDLASETGVIPSFSINKVETKPWLGFGVLQSKPNKLGEIALGLKSLNELNGSTVSTEINFFLSSNKSKFNFLVNNLKQIKKNAEKALVYLIPIAINSYLERKIFSFLNTEGELKRLKKVSNSSKKDKISTDPINLLLVVQNSILLNVGRSSRNSESNSIDSSSNSLKTSWFNLSKTNNWIKNHYLECFPGNMIPEFNTSFASECKNGLNVVYPWKLYSDRSLSYDSLIEDFYLTDNIRRSSLKMSHCSALHRARTTNFFKS